MNDRAEIEARLLKAAAALLHACKKAAAAFEECGFISVRSFKTKQPRGHKNKAALSTKKPRSAPSFIARAQQSRSDDDKLKAHVQPGGHKKKTRRCQSRPPLPKPLSVVKAALRC